MTSAAEALGILLGALRSEASHEAIIGASTVQAWPDGLLSALTSERLLVSFDAAEIVVCPGCQESCIMECKWIGDEEDQPFLLCNKPQQYGLIELDAGLRNQWTTSRRQVAAFVGHQLGVRIKTFDNASGRTSYGLSRRLGVLLSLEFQDAARLRIGDDAYDLVDMLLFERESIGIDQVLVARLAADARRPADGGKRYQPSSARREAKKSMTALRDLSIQDAADEIVRDGPPMKKAAVVDKLLEDPRFENMSRGRLERLFVIRKKLRRKNFA